MIKQTKILMDMPVTVAIVDQEAKEVDLQTVFNYFQEVENRFSIFKKDSEISLINDGKIKKSQYTSEMKEVLKLCEQTKKETDGFFDINHDGKIDPSGIVKGWAIFKAAKLLKEKGFQNYFLEAGGDIQTSGKNDQGKAWRVGIRNPFNYQQIVKVLSIIDRGVATSGTYLRGQHLWQPQKKNWRMTELVSLTVIGSNIYEADRFATTCFVMGKEGLNFLEKLAGFEGYLIDKNGLATWTSGFEKYVSV